jgi:hypothetical protein
MKNHKYLYVEVNNYTDEITVTSPYIYTGKKLDIDVIRKISDDKYTGYIIDIEKYTKKFNRSVPKDMSTSAHYFIIGCNRKNKINIIKNRINGERILDKCFKKT